MIDPGKSLLVAMVAACFAAAPGAAGAQKKAAKDEKDTPHWADSPPRARATSSATAATPAGGDQAEAEAAKRKKEQEAEARRLAALEKEKEARRKRQEMEARCVIKPVMTDADIENCRDLSR